MVHALAPVAAVATTTLPRLRVCPNIAPPLRCECRRVYRLASTTEPQFCRIAGMPTASVDQDHPVFDAGSRVAVAQRRRCAAVISEYELSPSCPGLPVLALHPRPGDAHPDPLRAPARLG